MQHIAILDFGSQYTHLIARRIRELKVLAKIYPTDVLAADLPADVAGIILSGGPQSVYDPNGLTIDPAILKLGKPILGLCYGHQLLAHLLGGRVLPGTVREYGRSELKITESSPLLSGVTPQTTVWMSHGDTVVKLPPNFVILGATDDCLIAAMADETKKIYGLQFHPEVHHTSEGKKILANFALQICACAPQWEIANLLDDIIAKIKTQAQNKKVFLLVSGGVDSSVCFALLEKALGKDRVFGLHIDTGFMRANESSQVKEALKQAGYDNLHTVDASQAFFKNLQNITEPEQKRKIIGQTFLDIAASQGFKPLANAGDEWLLGQGTIYPDTIESGGTKHADKIKTHHNRIDAIADLIAQGKVIEPLADFYKDEVRELGRLLGLPDELIDRHPFPGPGLAIRVLCSPPLPEANPPLTPPWKGGDIKYSLLPIKSVGVQGDNRTYAHPLAVWGETDWQKLDQLSSQITNANRHINRVLLLLNPPAFAKASAGKPAVQELDGELHQAYLTPKRVELLRQIDALVTAEIIQAKLYASIWQFPVVLVPFGQSNQESIVLRPIISEEAMTAHFARLPQNVLNHVVEQILATGKISYVFYDITNKPPGTIEWE